MCLVICLGASVAQAASDDEMVLIPAGKFIMGSDKGDAEHMGGEYGNVKPLYLDEHPQHTVELPSFYIDRYEVTNGQYVQYVIATGATPPLHWAENGYLLNLRKAQIDQLPIDKLRKLVSKAFHLDIDTLTMTKEALVQTIDEHLAYMDRLPVNYVTWSDADQFCSWAGKRLPSEAEWEKTARGPNGREFPWGDIWKAGMSDTESEQWDEGVAPVGSYETDKSEYGVYDLTGNVSEWVADCQPYPGSDYKSNDFGEKFKVVKGAGWGGNGHYTLHLFERSAYRGDFPPEGNYADVGFRCAVDASPAAQARLAQ
jgi:formylglycine-generating enzyme required for sulfatase activity